MTPRIRWESNGAGVQLDGWCGYVATMKPWAFQIWDPDTSQGLWRLDSALLGQFAYHVDHPDPEALKLHAERWLEQFVSSLGAVFPPEPVADPDCQECGFGLPCHDKNCSYYREPAKETGQ